MVGAGWRCGLGVGRRTRGVGALPAVVGGVEGVGAWWVWVGGDAGSVLANNRTAGTFLCVVHFFQKQI